MPGTGVAAVPDDATPRPAARARQAALICNPRAGNLSRLDDPVPTLEQALEAAGYSIVARPPAEAGLDEQWRHAVDAGARVVFVAGGDGTLRSAAQLALRDGVPLALLPGGTMNRVCERLGLPPDPVRAVASYTDARRERLAVGMAGDQPFLFQCLLGEPARLLRYREMQRGAGVLGWLPLLRAAWRRLRGLAGPGVALRVPRGPQRGATLRGVAASVTVPAPGEAASLAIDVVRPGGALVRLRQSWRWFRGRLSEDPDTVALHARRCSAHGSRRLLRFSLDGEMRMAPPPLRIRLHPQGVWILRPRAPEHAGTPGP